jgi:2-oxo-4-hydroxy-4-carboxy-5-ureidoimidazoline decarboxylase
LPEKIAIADVNNLDQRGFVSRFGALYEHSPWIAERVWHERPFGSFAQLHGAFVQVMYDAPLDQQLALIRAHPDLAGKAAIAGELTRESAREQASAGLDRLTPEEYEEFHRLNAAYREKFGFPLIIAVRENSKETILAGAGARLEHSRSQEIETALGEITKIACFRLQDLVEQDNPETEFTSRERKSG